MWGLVLSTDNSTHLHPVSLDHPGETDSNLAPSDLEELCHLRVKLALFFGETPGWLSSQATCRGGGSPGRRSGREAAKPNAGWGGVFNSWPLDTLHWHLLLGPLRGAVCFLAVGGELCVWVIILVGDFIKNIQKISVCVILCKSRSSLSLSIVPPGTVEKF